ncbi:MAG: cadherin repeat domain-containing protein [Fibrobacter sp.]|nr:cadherin repeat domain-containing protein [Fibrobacter sp.]
MLKGMINKVYLAVAVLGLFGGAFGAKVAPLYFESLGNSAAENADSQQEYWEGLMKYKLWGSEGLTFNKHTVHIADKNGYNGTATGDISFFNGAHHVGGPLLSGKGLHLSDDGTTPNNDTLSGGPVRVLGDFAIADWAANSGPVSGAIYEGPYCVQGSIRTRSSQAYDNTLTNWAAMVKGGVYGTSGMVAADAATADSTYTYNVEDTETGDLVPVTEYYKYVAYPFAVGTYQSCPVEVPPVDTHLRVPLWPEPAEWAPGINMSNGIDEVAYIHVPPESAYINEYGTYDLYIENIYMHNSAHKYLYVVMPHGGRLTRIFVRDGFNIQPSANSAVIQVVYVDRNAVYNTTTKEWDVSALVDSNYISNAKYAGNLMFYTNKDVHWKSMVKPSYQGTFMTTGKFTIENHFTLAGQLVANNLWFESDIVGDFRYVPFDPPILKIDPEVLQNGAFPENNDDAEIPISLDTVTNTSVDFNYCFDLDLSTAELADFQRTSKAPFPICEWRDTSWTYTFDEDGVTKLDSTVAGVTVTRDSGYVVIPAHRLTPYDANKAYLNVFIDGIGESEEYLHMKIFNLAGAVLEGNEREGHFTLTIVDANNPPVAGASSVTGTEDVAYTFKKSDFAYSSSKGYAEPGVVVATLPNKGTLTYKGGNVTAGQFIPVDSIGDLKYTGKKDDFGTPATTFQFKVRDEMNSTSGAAIMTVNLAAVNDPPSATASEFTVAENSAVGVKATGSLVVKDVDDNAFVYTLVGGATDIFQINSSTGEISVKKAVLDHETKSTYTVTVHVRDMASTTTLADTLSYNVAVTIRVTDVNEKPTIVDANLKVPEICDSGTVVGPVVATERDTAAAFTKLAYTIVESGVPFVMDSNIVKVKDPSKLDYEADSVLTFHVVVNDGQYTDTAVVTVKLTDVNEPPHFGDNIPVLTVDENAPADTHVGVVTASDVDGTENLTYSIIDETGTFKIVPSTGEIKVIADSTIDFETKSTYTVKVVVTDKDGLTDTATVTIKVNDVNEAPSIEDAVFAIDENPRKGDSAGAVIASDLDTAAQFRVLTYEIVETDVPFELDSNIIRVKEPGKLDYETDSVFTFHVVVTDQDGLSDTATITVNLNDTPEPPKFDDKTPTFAVDENVPAGTFVGVVTASDVDEDDVLTYSIGDPTDTFVIDEVTGKITVKADSTIDYETKNEYTVTVVVTDKYGYTDTATVTIKVNDVNEAPDVPDQTITVKEDAVVGSDVGKIAASDPDTAKAFSTLTYELVEESEQFSVKEDGTVVLKKELDYETDSVYVIKVRVTDGDLADTALVTVKVGNVVEKTELEITRAETKDSVWLNPDTLFINTTDLCIEWKADGKLMGPDCDLDLHEGENVIVKEYKTPGKDVPGVDTLVVFVSKQSPVVTVTAVVDDGKKPNIFTIVEEQQSADTAFYVNSKKNDILVKVKDPVSGAKDSFVVKLDLDTMNIPAKTFTSTLEGFTGAGLTLNENPASGASHTPVNDEKVAVSYTEVVNGQELTVTYYTDKDGNIIESADGVKVMTVAYVTEVKGQKVVISYNVDAVTGEVVKTSGGYAKPESSSSGSDKSSDKSSSSGKSGDKDSGKSATFENAVVFTVTYDYVDDAGNTVTVAYGVDAEGNLVKNEDGNLGYEVSYTYTNKYGNSATQSVFIVLDQVPPKVEILFPLEGDVIYSNFVDVKWTVDIGDGRGAVVQDTLITQGLVKGGNAIVRFYRDKAGNEASDTVRVIMKNAKDVDIAIEQAVTEITKDKVAEYYATHEPAEGETYAVTIYNSKTEKEVETLVGGGYKTKTGSGEEPYPGLPGHLGPTLGIETKVPTINAVGGLATLDDIVGSDGLVPLEGVDAEESEKVTVEEYVQQYCSTEFAENVGADLSKANLYSTKMYVKIWIYTSLGQFADYYAFTQDLNNPEYVNDAGLLTLYFEMKPDKDGNVRSETGRLYATGAYVFRTEVEMKSMLRCSLPPFVKTSGGMEPEKPTNKVGSARTVKEDLLKSFGYKRPNMK